jgi:hypothetical protein
MFYRWLIDTDKDVEGMRVIADLHGGNLDNPIAVAEYREIKDKVHEEVSITCFRLLTPHSIQPSENLAKADHMQ